MYTSQFYQIINKELEECLDKNISDAKTHLHKNKDQNKGYAMLIWFLEFYGQKNTYQRFITDGKDDSACDIIFSNKNVEGEEIYYAVQSKWVNEPNSQKAINKEELGYTISEFTKMLNGKKENGTNEAFNQKYIELIRHWEGNGKMKFVYFTLASPNPETSSMIAAFNQNYSPNIQLELIDIERLKRDFIEFRYKQIRTNNPLEYTYTPEDRSIEIEIERENKRDIFELNGRSKAYIFVLKPKAIFELFKKYQFSLFFKNVRNPLAESNYNPKIVETLLTKPNAFWYFNNGITAITKVMAEIGVHAKKIKVEGLQIINGAQTVYSIYQAYLKATKVQRMVMDSEARISFRLIRSNDEEFNLQITRYTNLQNPMLDRDFWANDDIQQKLQNESFSSNLWYERRRGEFRLSPQECEDLGIMIAPNELFIGAYLAFHLEKPQLAINEQKYFFISQKDHPKGLYETIFNANTKFEDMYVALQLGATYLQIVQPHTFLRNYTFESILPKNIAASANYLLIFKWVANTYFGQTKDKKFQLNYYLKKIFLFDQDEKTKEILALLYHSIHIFVQKLTQVYPNDLVISRKLSLEDDIKNFELMNQYMSDVYIYAQFKTEIEADTEIVTKIQKIMETL